MVRIRLRRIGRKKAPVYRIVVADSKSPRDGKFIEVIGQYHPRVTEGGLNVNEERANYWMSVGAQPSDTVRSLLRRAAASGAGNGARTFSTNGNGSPVIPTARSVPHASSSAPAAHGDTPSGCVSTSGASR